MILFMEFSIGAYEGPLDLLLALVRKEEMDISDIDIHKITSQYLSVIQTSKLLNLDEGGEFIRMAAILILIKSRSLLPQMELEDAEEGMELEISKEDLIRNLTEHSQFLKAAEKLNQRSLLNRDIWLCSGLSFVPSNNKEEIEEGSLSSLVKVFRKILKQAYVYKARISMPSVLEWIKQIRQGFVKGKTLLFSQLIQKEKSEPLLHQILLSFLSLLELGRMGFVSLSQEGKEIQIHTKKTVDESVFQSKILDQKYLNKEMSS